MITQQQCAKRPSSSVSRPAVKRSFVVSKRSEGVAQRRRPSYYCAGVVPVKCSCPRLKGVDHLFHHFIKEHTGQLRVQKRLELKGHLQKTKEKSGLLT